MPDAPTKKHTLLLVDDDQFLLNMYALKFRNSGFEVDIVNSAAVALQKLREGLSPDVILCDLIMPAMDGFEFLKRLREERLASSSAVMVLTNTNQQDEIDRAMKFEIDGYIVKASAIPSEVVEEVKTVLSKKTK